MHITKEKHERQEVTIRAYSLFTFKLTQKEKDALFKLLDKTNLNQEASIFTMGECEILYELYRQLAEKS